MKIRDIVNRDIVNLSNCNQEPIHIPGSIQPHGFLLAFDNNFVIQFCSANVSAYTGYLPEQLLTKDLSEAFGEYVASEIKEYTRVSTGDLSAPLTTDINHKKYYCTTHKSGDVFIGEFEPLEKVQPQVYTVYDQSVRFLKYMEEAQTLQQLCTRVATEIRSLTGYDRVMVYRFDKDYNGEVYAESKRDDLEAFLGLHYPHTDIPVQARQLYIKNLLRLIPDIGYEPVPLLTIDDQPGKNLDLGLATLRSVSPIHVQYLQNMGVGATLTISLLHEGKLWGLIACHHYSVKYIDHYTRINARLQGHFLTSQIKVRQAAEEYENSKQVNAALESLLNQSYPGDRESLKTIVAQPQLLSVCNAAGVAIQLDGEIYTNGNTPAKEKIKELAEWIEKNNSKQVMYSTSKLADDYPANDICSTASGLIHYSLSDLHHASITWFNPETLEEVNWAGDPDKAIEKDANGLSPRKSFESWRQVVKCQAKEWSEPELTAAASFASALQKHITLILLTEEENRQRQLTEKLREANAELENINWISTHDLKEPLRKIQVFTSRMLEKEKTLEDEVVTTFTKVNQSAGRMQRLITDLMAYSRLRQPQDGFQDVDLNNIMRDIQQEFSEDISNTNAHIVFYDLPIVKGIPVLLHQLLANLVQNSLKFARANVAPVIEVTYKNVSNSSDGNSYHHVVIKDNGIGFDPKNNESVFKVFTRLHTVHQYSGSGIGLALCKKIMQIHGGSITADGKPQEGISVTLLFPLRA